MIWKFFFVGVCVGARQGEVFFGFEKSAAQDSIETFPTSKREKAET